MVVRKSGRKATINVTRATETYDDRKLQILSQKQQLSQGF